MVDKAAQDGMINYKVVMLGESGVGKTCIVNKLIKGTFEVGKSEPTIGSNYCSKIETIQP